MTDDLVKRLRDREANSMKTAEKWAKEAKCDKFHHGECECFDRMGSKLQGSCDEIADIIRAVQRDAIEAAIDALPANVASNTEWIASFDIGIDACRDAIRSLLPFAQSAPRE